MKQSRAGRNNAKRSRTCVRCASERLVRGNDGAARKRHFLAEKEPTARSLSSISATSDNCQNITSRNGSWPLWVLGANCLLALHSGNEHGISWLWRLIIACVLTW